MSARLAANKAILSVVKERKALSDRSFSGLAPNDAALAKQITMGCLKRHGDLDGLLKRLLSRPLPNKAIETRVALWIGLLQLLDLNTPDHAAVSTTLDVLPKGPAAKGQRGLVNAVLRRVTRERNQWTTAYEKSQRFFVPEWMAARWHKQLGAEPTNALLAALQNEASTDLSLKPSVDGAALAEQLGAQVLPGNRLRLAPKSGRIDSLPGFATGDWWVQDFAASLPVNLMGDVSGAEVLDLCAAPGGKTLQLVSKGANVTAVDNSAERLKRLEENLKRTKQKAKLVCANALELPAYFVDRFDAVLLDAPCSATGTLRRHPDLPWLRDEKTLLRNVPLQRKMVVAASKALKSGGKLVYAVCSFEEEERLTAANLPSSLKMSPLKPGDIIDTDIDKLLIKNGALETAPSTSMPEFAGNDFTGMDGFYAALFVKT